VTVETVELSVEFGIYDAAHRIAVNLLKSLNSKGIWCPQNYSIYTILTSRVSRLVRVRWQKRAQEGAYAVALALTRRATDWALSLVASVRPRTDTSMMYCDVWMAARCVWRGARCCGPVDSVTIACTKSDEI
jgi:hypothetical protein